MRKLLYLGAVLAGSAGFALAAYGAAASPAKPRPSVTALRVEQPPVIDGALDEDAWQKAPAAGDFKQYEPKDGVPMTERTEFRILYSDEALYIGIWCYDSEPNKILARTMSRDDYPDEDDFVSFSIDPFHDRRNGYMFAINPNGTRFDAIINNNAYAGNSWDAIWDCRGKITDKGWFCEIAIPFDSIAFAPNNSTWGFNIARTIRRKNERGRWHSEGRHLSTSAMANAGEIRGLEGLGNVTKWEFLPYGMGKYRHNNDTGNGNTLGDFGGDISYRLAPNLNASLSVNTDFAETEVDYRQLNFTRFSLQYPEKRDFFLKDSGIFKFGPASRRSRSQSSTPFFSRRIGLTHSGHQVPINLATKITGRVGKYNIGMIGAMIDKHDGIGSQNVFVTRISRNVLEQSSIGMISTMGDPNSDKDAYMIGTDFNYRTTKFLTDKTLRASVYTMANFDDDTDWSYAHGANISYPNDLIDAGVSFYQVDEEFKPKLGYTRRTGIRRFGSSFSYRPRPENIDWLRKYHLSYRNSIYTTLDNDIESQRHSFYIPYLDFESGHNVYFKIEQEYDKPDRDFGVSGGGVVPAGEYWMTNYTLDFDLRDAGLINGGFGYELGDWYHGEKQTAYFRLGFDPTKWLNTSLSYSYNHFELPDTEFDAQIASGNIRINFTPDMGWSHLIQYDNVSESIGYNTRFFWEFQPGKKFYIVVRQNYGDEDRLFSLRESEFAVKAITTFRF
ncbi:MAG: carbohydrate binding family 9 domain-containing protein [Pedosphaera sp.]|nr:carbohydrate binding family 9 domain-containing protein [Pedosphaera sp.]